LKWQFFIPSDFKCDLNFHIDLGSGKRIRNPFNSIRVAGSDYKLPKKQDQHMDSDFYIFDLTKDFPFENNSISTFSAFDVIEHIPRWERISDDKIKFTFIGFMNEVNRCLIAGGYFFAVTPAYPSVAAFQDPTHVNFITEETLNYFFEPSSLIRSHGFNGLFEKITMHWDTSATYHVVWEIKVVK
jgi:SAM-dependent methyltransferase